MQAAEVAEQLVEKPKVARQARVLELEPRDNLLIPGETQPTVAALESANFLGQLKVAEGTEVLVAKELAAEDRFFVPKQRQLRPEPFHPGRARTADALAA